MSVSTGPASPVLPPRTSFTWRSDMKLPVHLMRFGSISSATMRLPRCNLLTLLNVGFVRGRYVDSLISPSPGIRPPISFVQKSLESLAVSLVGEAVARACPMLRCPVFRPAPHHEWPSR